MPRLEFEPTILVFERAKTVHALDRAANVIITLGIYSSLFITLSHLPARITLINVTYFMVSRIIVTLFPCIICYFNSEVTKITW
jgi:hypothetical protein